MVAASIHSHVRVPFQSILHPGYPDDDCVQGGENANTGTECAQASSKRTRRRSLNNDGQNLRGKTLFQTTKFIAVFLRRTALTTLWPQW
jgi:hypothetical protein